MGLVKPVKAGMSINGVIESYTVQAGNNINAGDFVDFINGQVASHKTYSSPKTSLIYGAGYSNTNYSLGPVSATKLSSTQVLTVFWMGGSPYAQVLTFNGTTISSGSVTEIYSSATGNDSMFIKVKAISATQALCTFQSGGMIYAIFIYINGSTLTFGTNYQIETGQTYYSDLVLNGNLVMFTYTAVSTAIIYARAATIGGSGTSLTLTLGTAVSLATCGTTNSPLMSEVKVVDPTNNVFITSTYNNSNLYIMTFSVSGTTISLIQSGSFAHTGTINGTSIVFKVLSTSIVAMFYYDSTNTRVCYVILNLTSSSIGMGTEIVIYTGAIFVTTSGSYNKWISIEDYTSNFGTNYFILGFATSGSILEIMFFSYTNNSITQISSSFTYGINNGWEITLMCIGTDQVWSVHMSTSAVNNEIINFIEQKFGVATTAGTAGQSINVAV